MNVGHLIQWFPMLTETFIRSYLRHAKKSHPLVLAETLFLDVDDQIPVSYLIDSDDRKQFSRDQLRYFLRELNYPTCYQKLAKKKKTDLLHAHFGQVGYKTLSLKERVKCPLVTSFYGIDASLLIKSRGWQKRFAHLFDVGDAFVCLGTQMKDRLCAVGCPEEKLHIIHLGVDVKNISFKSRMYPDDGGCIYLLYCGRLVEKKGIFDALQAFKQVANLWPQMIFRIVGDGELKQKLIHRIQELGLADRVEVLGALDHHRVLEEMGKAHLFILPSKTARNGNMEGTPTVLLEAQASGLPVLSTYHADIPEVVLDGRSGFLVDEGDVDALAGQLGVLLSQPQKWAEFGDKGRKHIEQHYNIYHEVKKLEALYQELV